jgi:hypothetical protein
VRRAALVCALLASHALARAEEPIPAAGAAGAADQTPSTEEIEKALKADQAAKEKSHPAQASPSTAPSAGAGAAEPAARAPTSALGRFIQSLNPDISAILDLAAGFYSNEAVTLKSGDDPANTGFNVQEIELAFQAVVDPYFRADIFVTVPNLETFELEEAVLTTTSLPWNLQVRAGIFRAAFGRENMQHLHLQDFTRRPKVGPLFLGLDGLRSPGLEVNWLVPKIPFYLLLEASAFSVAASGPNEQLASFGGGEHWDFTYVASAKAFWELGESSALYVGLSYAHGKTSQTQTQNEVLPSARPITSDPFPTTLNNLFSNLYGTDIYFKWKPANAARTYLSVAWTTEFMLRHIPEQLTAAGAPSPSQLEGGLYTQLVVQAARRWYLGLRGEVLGIPEAISVRREYATAASITFAASEFARIRLYGESRFPAGADVYGALFVQLEASIGAHGAHPY